MAASDQAAPLSRREDALAVLDTLVHAGHIAYFAGGCVRDMLLKLPSKDFDVATSATPDVVRTLFPRSQGVGQAFGVVIVRAGRSMIEIATFRADGSYADGRRPDEVRFATAEEDAQRRDFTINGLFYDPKADQIIDHVGGQADLTGRMLRAIGDPNVRFAEDYLRMLRAVRFAARFDLAIDPATADAIRTNASKLPRIAPERIADELRATLMPLTRVRGRALLDELGLTAIVFRHVLAFAARPEASPGVAVGIFDRLAPQGPIPFALALAGLIADLLLAHGQTLATLADAQHAAKVEHALRQTLRLSNDESAAFKTIVSALRLLAPAVPRVATYKRFLAQPYASDAQAFLEAIAAAGIERERIAMLLALAASYAPGDVAPPPLLDGDDLQTLGYRPGPRFRTTLDAVYDAQLENQITTRDEAIGLAKSILDASSK